MGLAGRADRPTRLWCLVAALAPDLDGLSLLFGEATYGEYHHLLAHNLPFGLLITLASVRWAGPRPLPLALVFTAFLSHLVGDFFGSGPGWGLWPFRPFSDDFYACECAWNLVSWQNTLITLGAIAVTAWGAIRQGHTPLEFIHAGLERAVVDTLQLRSATAQCSFCAGRASVRCQGCRRPICQGHLASRRHFRLRCPDCQT